MSEAGAGIGNVIQSTTLTTMAMGYARSRVLCAAARLGVADALGDRERNVSELASECQANPDALHRLLRALASFNVLTETAPGKFRLTPFGSTLRKDVPGSEWAAVVFWADLLADCWSYLTECVRSGDNGHRVMEREGIASRWSKDPNANAVFRAVMGTAPAENYAPIARAWDFSNHHVVADLGGGGGALISAVLLAFPNVRGMLVDRPESVNEARPRFESHGLASRCELIAADLCKSVPAGADVYMLKHVLHGYTDKAAVDLLRNCLSVMAKDGKLLVIEFVLPDVVDHADPDLETRLMSDLNMLAVTTGKERTAGEWRTLLRNSGFECRAIVPVTGQQVSIIEAVPRT